jgi:hypothetical protein
VQDETSAAVPASETIPASSWRRVGSMPGQRPVRATAFPRAAPAWPPNGPQPGQPACQTRQTCLDWHP